MQKSLLRIATLAVTLAACLLLWRSLESAPVAVRPPVAPAEVDPSDSQPAAHVSDGPSNEETLDAGGGEPRSSSHGAHLEKVIPDSSPTPREGGEQQLAAAAMLPRGSFVDARTGEPVPALRLTIRSWETNMTGSTRNDGTIATRTDLPFGPLNIEIHDAGSLISRANEVHRIGVPLEIEVPIGPTCPVLFDSGEDGLTSWKARIVETRQGRGSGGRIEVLERGLRVAATGRRDPGAHDGLDVVQDYEDGSTRGSDVADRKWPWVSVRRGDPPWIRYPTIHWDLDDRYQARLELRHSSGAFGGASELSSTVGVQPAVSIEIQSTEPRGTLKGRVSDASGKSVRAIVILLPTHAERQDKHRPPFFAEQSTDKDGLFEFEGIPVGTRKALVYAANRPTKSYEVKIVGGENLFEEVILEEERRRTHIQVRFWASEKMTGGYASRLRLAEAGPFGRAWLGRGGHYTPTDRVQTHRNLPLSKFDYLGIGSRMAPRWTPAQLLLESHYLGQKECTYELDEVPIEKRAAFGFEVTSANKEMSLTSFEVYLGPGGAMYHSTTARHGDRLHIAPETPLAWAIWAPGFSPSCGTEADFVERNGEQIAPVSLVVGWGALLYFRVGNPRTFLEEPGPWGEPWEDWRFPAATSLVGALAAPPLPNIRIEVDGDTVAISDAEGHACIALPARPDELSIVSPGWRIAGLEPIGVRGDNDLRYRHIVWMERK